MRTKPMIPGKIRIGIIAVLALVVLSGIIAAVLRQNTKKGHREKILFGVSMDPSSAPIFVAYKKGFFEQEGLDVSLRVYTTGKASLSSLIRGEVRFATIADTVLMFAAMDRKDIFAIATIADSNKHHGIVGLRERGISSAGDLVGRKIGITTRTSGEFFLYSFLLFRDIPFTRVQTVNMPPEEMYAALVNGTVDAVATWYPTVGSLMQKLNDRAITFEDTTYVMTWNVVGQQAFVKASPGAVESAIRGLLHAQEYMAGNPKEAVSITAAFTRSDPVLLKNTWNYYNYDIRLGEELLISLEDQARWAMRVYYPQRKRLPDFTEYLYTAGLREVVPHAVTLPLGKGKQ